MTGWYISTGDIVVGSIFILFVWAAASLYTTGFVMEKIGIKDGNYRYLFVLVPVATAYAAALVWGAVRIL